MLRLLLFTLVYAILFHTSALLNLTYEHCDQYHYKRHYNGHRRYYGYHNRKQLPVPSVLLLLSLFKFFYIEIGIITITRSAIVERSEERRVGKECRL